MQLLPFICSAAVISMFRYQ